jgi:hypothetical protein
MIDQFLAPDSREAVAHTKLKYALSSLPEPYL